MKLESIRRRALKEARKEMENLRKEYVEHAAAEISDTICPHLVRKSFVWRCGTAMVVVAYDEKCETNNILIVRSIDVKPVKDTFLDTDMKNKALSNAMRLLDTNYEDILKSFFKTLSDE